MKMLFIGGTQDGEFIEVPDNKNIWDVANLSKVPIRSYCKRAEVPITAPAGTVERYRRVSISLCEMMLVDHLSVGEVIPRLMGNYSPEV